MLTKVINKIIGDPNEKAIKSKRKVVEQIHEKALEFEVLSEEQLKAKTEEFKERYQKGESLDDMLVEAFAVVKCAAKKLMGTKFVLGDEEKTWEIESPFDVQLLGGSILHDGKIAEMKTGEGKTFVAVFPLYLNALAGKGAHLVTVNDYLARRDAAWMGHLYNFLGLSVGTILHGKSNEERREAYNADITYGTNNEFGFDYLRDNMARSLEERVQRPLHYAIVDEVDSILIDEARTPLIISAPAEESTQKYFQYSTLINQLQRDEHFTIDEKSRTATLTEEGISKMEQLLGVENIYTEAGFMEVHHIEQALKAHAIFKRDTDYVVNEGEIVIVDEFTGRLMPGRRYSDGLHQAIEAKENVEVKRESKTLASITFQNYFRLYEKLAGMTGTAKTEEEEFFRIYNLDTVVIPTNKPIARQDKADLIYKNVQGKYKAVVQAIREYNENGQPVLVGTISVERSELLSKLLNAERIKHEVLNAKNHEREAEIVAKAGQKGAVTIATNMAGRGTDIKLGEGVLDLGGLVILGTERHESRRIDNQLRGRAGRQGDPGVSRFFVSMEDDLMRLFGADKIKGMMEKLGLPDDMPIENRLISRSIESAQKRVEGNNFDIRKHILEYDDVMNRHREIIYERRLKVLENEDLKQEILDMMKSSARHIVTLHCEGLERIDWDLKAVSENVNALLPHDAQRLDVGDIEGLSDMEDIIEAVTNIFHSDYAAKEKALPEPEMMRDVEKRIYLSVMDRLWMEHIDQMAHLRDSVSLRGYGQRDPLMEYKGEAFTLFKRLLDSIQHNTLNTLFKVNMQAQVQVAPVVKAENMQTNEDQIEQNLNESSLSQARKVAKQQAAIRNASPEAAVAARILASKPASPAQPVVPEAGRNEPCPCGSGKKYKKCHGQGAE